jgi:acylglycerol lipase
MFINGKHGKINIIEGKPIYNIKAIIIHIHGIGSHFQPVYKCHNDFHERDNFFSNVEYKSFAFEFHGHGRSDGIRCCIKNFNDLVNDLENVIIHILNMYSDKKIFLLAESMGGAVVLKYIIDNINITDFIKGIILLSPLCGIDENIKPSQFLVNLLRFTSYIFPTKRINLSSTNIATKTTRNIKYQELKQKCPYNFDAPYPLCTLREIYNISLWIPLNVSKWNIPLLIFYGSNDTVISYEGIKTTFDNIQYIDKELVILPNTEHSILVPNEDNDYIPQMVYIKMLNWLNLTYSNN